MVRTQRNRMCWQVAAAVMNAIRDITDYAIRDIKRHSGKRHSGHY